MATKTIPKVWSRPVEAFFQGRQAKRTPKPEALPWPAKARPARARATLRELRAVLEHVTAEGAEDEIVDRALRAVEAAAVAYYGPTWEVRVARAREWLERGARQTRNSDADARAALLASHAVLAARAIEGAKFTSEEWTQAVETWAKGTRPWVALGLVFDAKPDDLKRWAKSKARRRRKAGGTP